MDRFLQLPAIWAELGEAGLESGHAYGKALRTVKSCVGSTWCRYGVQDAVSFAVQVENRYKGEFTVSSRTSLSLLLSLGSSPRLSWCFHAASSDIDTHLFCHACLS